MVCVCWVVAAGIVTLRLDPVLVSCWASVADGWPTFNQYVQYRAFIVLFFSPTPPTLSHVGWYRSRSESLMNWRSLLVITDESPTPLIITKYYLYQLSLSFIIYQESSRWEWNEKWIESENNTKPKSRKTLLPNSSSHSEKCMTLYNVGCKQPSKHRTFV